MRINKLTLYTILSIGLLLTACISTSSEPEIVATRLVQVPTPAPPPTQFSLQTGAELYASSCAPCHGETGLGDGATASAFTCPVPAFAREGANVELVDWFRVASNGKRTSESCIMPPWSGRLSSDEIWQAVIYAASLRHDYTLKDRGAELLAGVQVADAVDYLTDTQWQVDNSDAEILLAMQQNTLEGFNFAELPSDEDRQAILAYIRSLSYSGGTEVASLPQPIETEQAVTPEETVPEPLETEAVDSDDLFSPLDTVTSPSGTFTITGTVTNGTAGGTVPDDLVLTVRVVRINEAGEPEEAYRAETPITPDKTFTFADVPRSERAIAAIETEYAGVRQLGQHTILDDLTEDQIQVDFVIYETTTEADISLLYVESVVDAVTDEGASLTFQNLEVVNNSDRIYLGDENGRTVTITFPKGAVNAQIDAQSSPPDRFEQTMEGDQVIFYDTRPLFPNTIERYFIGFNQPYNGSMQVDQQFPYPVQDIGVYISQSRGLRLESEQLTPIEPANLNGLTYLGFGLASAPLPAGTPFSYRVFDGPNVVGLSNQDKADDRESFLRENTPLILGVGVLLVVAGAIFMIYDLQRKRLQTQTALPALSAKQEELAIAIARLDDDYAAGKIQEKDYRQQREKLKARLRRSMR